MTENKGELISGKIESLPSFDAGNRPVTVVDRIAYDRAKATNLIAGVLLITVCVSIVPMVVMAMFTKDCQIYDRLLAIWDRWLNLIGPLAGVAVYAYFREGQSQQAVTGSENFNATR